MVIWSGKVPFHQGSCTAGLVGLWRVDDTLPMKARFVRSFQVKTSLAKSHQNISEKVVSTVVTTKNEYAMSIINQPSKPRTPFLMPPLFFPRYSPMTDVVVSDQANTEI